MQPLDFLLGEPVGDLEGRQLGPVQDLVGVGVADPAEQVRVRQRAFQRVAPARQRAAEGLEVGPEDLEAAGIVRLQPLLAPNEVERRAPLAALLGQHERAVREVESGEARLARQTAPIFLQCSARDHQVEDQEEIGFEPGRCVSPPRTDTTSCFHFGERRVDGTSRNSSSAAPARAFADDSRLEAPYGDDVGELRHGWEMIARRGRWLIGKGYYSCPTRTVPFWGRSPRPLLTVPACSFSTVTLPSQTGYGPKPRGTALCRVQRAAERAADVWTTKSNEPVLFSCLMAAAPLSEEGGPVCPFLLATVFSLCVADLIWSEGVN